MYMTAAHVKLPNTGHEYFATVPLESLTTPFCIANFASPCITRANTYKFIYNPSTQPVTRGGQAEYLLHDSRVVAKDVAPAYESGQEGIEAFFASSSGGSLEVHECLVNRDKNAEISGMLERQFEDSAKLGF